jgi:predicted transglutaminase-like cysteine proteinase
VKKFSLIGKLSLAVIAAISIDTMSAPAAVAGGNVPLGYSLMCLEHPEQCKSGGAAQVKATGSVLATLKRVNSHINRSIQPKYDSGDTDTWTINASTGDCEDYVLAKRAALIRAGIPASSLRIAYVKTRRGEGHAILVVKTNGKDLVLDNLTATIKPLSQTGYRIISISGANPMKWS